MGEYYTVIFSIDEFTITNSQFLQETNLYEAIQVAEHGKAKARLGHCPRLPLSRVEIIRRPIPQLERGTGVGKVAIRIALCGISSSWRKTYPDALQKFAHLFNMNAIAKPDISSFLSEHPMPKIDGGNSVKDEPQLDSKADDAELLVFGTQEGPLGDGYGYDVGSGIGARNDTVEDYAGREDNLVLEIRGRLEGEGDVAGAPASPRPGRGSNRGKYIC
jgi:hypothetical protein